MKLIQKTSIILFFLLFTCNSYASNQDLNCEQLITVDGYITALNSKSGQNEYLKKLKECVRSNNKNQDKLDEKMVNALTAMDLPNFPENDRKNLLPFVIKMLKVNAEAGNPSSQHNLAAIYNAKPGSPLYKLIGVNYKLFIKWTKAAASQGEPRSLFNLAVRMSSDEPVEGVNKDFKTAYILFKILKRMNSRYPHSLEVIMPEVNKEIKKISSSFDKKQLKLLDSKSWNFDFKVLNK